MKILLAFTLIILTVGELVDSRPDVLEKLTPIVITVGKDKEAPCHTCKRAHREPEEVDEEVEEEDEEEEETEDEDEEETVDEESTTDCADKVTTTEAPTTQPPITVPPASVVEQFVVKRVRRPRPRPVPRPKPVPAPCSTCGTDKDDDEGLVEKLLDTLL